MKDQNVLITGASKGIGLELARQFAKHGYSIILTATNETELEEAAIAKPERRKRRVGSVASKSNRACAA